MLRGQNAMHYSRARLITHIYYAMLHLTLHTKRTKHNASPPKAIHEITVQHATKLISFLSQRKQEKHQQAVNSKKYDERELVILQKTGRC